MPTQIKFGTSGWRAVMAEEFTFANVSRSVTGIARYVAGQKPQGARILVGRDPRFLGETFCDMAAQILIQHGITPLVITQAARRRSTRACAIFSASSRELAVVRTIFLSLIG